MAASLVDKIEEQEYSSEEERARDESIAEGVCGTTYIAAADTVCMLPSCLLF
jgi:hypothetical protein